MSHPDPSKIRCVSVKNNDWGYFRKEDAMNKGWQNSTGFIPEELPEDAPEPLLKKPEIPSPDFDFSALTMAQLRILAADHKFSEDEHKNFSKPNMIEYLKWKFDAMRTPATV
ncbi:MAG: hypothetical protein WBB36_11705 [Chitinophagales bacterium]